jgi:lysozyme family protein
MAKSTYDEALRRLLVHEGGYTNHPSDPGGPTNFGITIQDYRKYVKPNATAADVRAMKLDQAKAIYRIKYWDAQRCDELPAGVDYSVFDYGVNSGIGRSGKVLRRVLGLPDNTSTVTDQVLAAVAKRDAKAIIVAINDERLRFLKSLKTWPVFGAGWGRRVAEVRSFSLRLAEHRAIAAAPSPQPAPLDGPAAKGIVPLPKTLQKVTTATPITAGGVSATTLHQSGHDPWMIAALVGGFVLIAGVGWIAFHWLQQRKQHAPTPGLVPVPAIKGHAS